MVNLLRALRMTIVKAMTDSQKQFKALTRWTTMNCGNIQSRHTFASSRRCIKQEVGVLVNSPDPSTGAYESIGENILAGLILEIEDDNDQAESASYGVEDTCRGQES